MTFLARGGKCIFSFPFVRFSDTKDKEFQINIVCQHAIQILQNNDKVSLVVARRNNASAFISNLDEADGSGNGIPPSPAISSHARSKSAPAINHENGNNGVEAENSSDDNSGSSSNELSEEEEDEVDGGGGGSNFRRGGGKGGEEGADNQKKKDRIRNGSFVKRAVRKISGAAASSSVSSSAAAGESNKKIRAKHSSSPTLNNPGPRSSSHSVEDLVSQLILHTFTHAFM